MCAEGFLLHDQNTVAPLPNLIFCVQFRFNGFSTGCVSDLTFDLPPLCGLEASIAFG